MKPKDLNNLENLVLFLLFFFFAGGIYIGYLIWGTN